MLIKKHSVLPGFRLSLAFTLLYLSLLVLIPLASLVAITVAGGWEKFIDTITDPQAVASYKITFGASLAAATVNALFGLLIAWVFVRYQFPGRKLLDALIDIPFALPTAVSGIALTTLYASSGWLGKHFEQAGIKIAYSPVGITLALVFIGLPFVVRTVQPALQEMEKELEEVAESLGATPFQIARKVIFPAVLPAWLTGFALAFARGIGEYGSVIFIAGNMPFKTEITPLLIVTKLEQYDYAGATGLATVLLVASFALLLLINTGQAWAARRGAA